MQPNSCDRGPADLRPELHLGDSLDSPAILVLKFASFALREIDMAPRYVRLLLVLAEAWQEDDGEVEALRGFRSADEIGHRYARFSNAAGPIQARSVRELVYEVSTFVREAAEFYGVGSDGAPVTDLFDRRRMRGYRLGQSGLDVKRSRRARCASRSAGTRTHRRTERPADALARRIPGDGRP